MNAYNNRSLKVGIDALKEQLAHNGGNGGQNEPATDGTRERDRIGVGRVRDGGRARQILIRAGQYEIEERQLGGMLSPELEQRVLPANQATQHEHHGYGGQSDEHYERIGLLHHVEALLVAENLHDGHGSVGHRRPVHRSDEYAARQERTRLVYDPIENVQQANKHAAPRVDDYVGAVALRTRDFNRAIALLLLVHPALQTTLVDPFGCAFTFAR